MKYQPGLPEHNDNVSHDKPFSEFVLLITALLGVILVVYWVLGLFVDKAVNYISPETERAIFANVDLGGGADDKQAGRALALQEILDSLGECIDVGYPVRLSISESESANAFAVPGGKVVILSGLLEKLKSENGVVFVLAHELGHFRNRDHLRSIGRALVLLTLSVVLTGQDSHISNLLTPALNLETARFSQTREELADETALEILQCHYGHVGGATELFEVIRESLDKEGTEIGHYFSSHPEVVERIDNMERLAKKSGFPFRNVRELNF